MHRQMARSGGSLRWLVTIVLSVALLVQPAGSVRALPPDNNWPRLPNDGEIAGAAAAFQPAKPPATADNFRSSKWHNAANPVLSGLQVALTFDLHYRGQVQGTGPFRDLTDACIAWLTFNADARVFRFALAYCGDQTERTSRVAGLTAGWPTSVNSVDLVTIRPGEEPIGLVREVVGNGPVEVALLDPSAPGDAGDLATANWRPLPWDGRTRLPVGDRVVIRTGSDVEVVFLFSTGALTRIKPNTTLLIRRFETAQTPASEMYMRLFRGIINFYSEKAREETKRFEVEVDRAIVGIKGTQLTIEAADDGAAVVTVDEGEVEVTDKATGTVYAVSTGQRLTADGQQVVVGASAAAAASTGTAPPAPAAPPQPAGSAATSGDFTDEFDGPTLDPRWVVVNPNPDSTAGLTGNGTLRLQASAHHGGSDYSPLSNYQAPRVLHRIDGDWTIATHLSFSGHNDYSGAGLLLCPDSGADGRDCWRVAERFFGQGGDRIVAAAASPIWNSVPGQASQPVSTAASDVWLRVEKRGSQYTGWYSEDGTSWVQNGQRVEAKGMSWAGLFAVRQPWDQQTEAVTTASFAEYRYDPLVGVTPITTPTPTAPAPLSTVLFYNGNDAGVQSGPPNPTVFTLAAPQTITLIMTYHWNGGRGTPAPGTIGLRGESGRVYGPWPATGRSGQGNVPNAYWEVQPGVTLPVGTYTILDSEPATWAYNGQTGGRGIARVEGAAAVVFPPLGQVQPGHRDDLTACGTVIGDMERTLR